MNKLQEFQEIIGYHFRQEGLLRQALTHSSYANERHMKKLYNNERLEFLGDAVLEIVTSEHLYQLHPEWAEGELTRVRASIVCEQTLAFCTRALHLGDYVLLSKGEEHTGGREKIGSLGCVRGGDGCDLSGWRICTRKGIYSSFCVA